MAAAVQKITPASARDIPFNKLVLSQSNIRRVKAGVSIEDLAASIARRGLIQSLHVRPVLDAEGVETGMFEVPAGGRRYRALAMLVKEKRLNKTAPVPCVVGATDTGILMEEISLAENEERVPSAARELLNKSDNERSGVLSTAMSFLGLYHDPVVAEVTRRCDWRIADIVGDARPTTLYATAKGTEIDPHIWRLALGGEGIWRARPAG